MKEKIEEKEGSERQRKTKGQTERRETEKDESQRKKRREKSLLTLGQCVGPQLCPKLSFFFK